MNQKFTCRDWAEDCGISHLEAYMELRTLVRIGTAAIVGTIRTGKRGRPEYLYEFCKELGGNQIL